MEVSILIAKIFGIGAVIEGIVLLVRTGDVVAAMNSLKSRRGSLMAFVAFVILLGLLLTSVHNIWVGGAFVILITLIGWVMLIKGIFALLMPHSVTERLITKFNTPKTYKITGVIEIVVGLWLAYSGFVL